MAKKPRNQNQEILDLFSEDDLAVLRALRRVGEERVQKLISFHATYFPPQPKTLSRKEKSLLSQANLFNKLFPDFNFQAKRGRKKQKGNKSK